MPRFLVEKQKMKEEATVDSIDPSTTSWLDEDEFETSIVDQLPMMVCVVCYNEFSSYSVNCLTWETAMTKDFYVALNIQTNGGTTTEGQDEDSIVSLPFCPECHSKVSVMFSMHQQLKNILQSFNCYRNDLAFTIVETIDKNCRNGPLDMIRNQIFERWKDLYAQAKELSSSDVFDDKTKNEYLNPALVELQPSSVPSCSITKKTVEIEKSIPIIRKTQSALTATNMTTRNHIPSDSKTSMTALNKIQNKGKIIRLPNKKVIAVKRKRLNDGVRAKKQILQMPTLIPMAKLPTHPPPIKSLNGNKSTTGFRFNYGPKRGRPVKITSLKQQMMSETSLNKNPLYNPKVSGQENGSIMKKKGRIQRADGKWKCPYCPRNFIDLTQVKRHEGTEHPTLLPFICNMCPKGFHTIYSLRRHLRLVHLQIIEGYAKCPYCVSSFGTKSAFQHHVKLQHKGKRTPDYNIILQKIGTKKKSSSGPKKIKIPLVSPPSPEITDMEQIIVSSVNANSGTKKVNKPKPSSILSTKRKTNLELKSPIVKKERIDLQKNDIKTQESPSPIPLKKREISRKSLSVKLNRGRFSNGKSTALNKQKDDDKTPIDEVKENGGSESVSEELEEIEQSSSPKAIDVKPILGKVKRQSIPAIKERGGFTCSVCGLWFKNQYILGGHMNAHKRGWTIKENGTGN